MTDTPRIVGLDLSLTGTGLAFPGGTTQIIKTKPTEDKTYGGIMRCLYIAKSVVDEIGAHGGTHVVVEGYAYSRAEMAHSLGELGGIVRVALLEHEIPWVNINTSALKKFATGKGNVGKDEMIAHAIRDFGFMGSNNNEADAFLLRMMGEASLGRIGKLSLKRAQAVAGVAWPWNV